jgi:colicin import membrane protein
MIVTQLIAFGKPREKFWLPRIVVPPKPKAPEPTIKLSEDPNAAPVVKEAPKIEDPDISKNLRNALNRAKMLAAANAEDGPAEGSLSGSMQGTSTDGVTGDAYATAIYEAIKRNWMTPTGLITEAELATLTVEVRVSIHEDGTLANPSIKKSSGNLYFDDSCVQAIKSTGRVPPPPAPLRTRFQRGTLLDFRGSDLTR